MQLVRNRFCFLSAGKEKQFYDYFFFPVCDCTIIEIQMLSLLQLTSTSIIFTTA